MKQPTDLERLLNRFKRYTLEMSKDDDDVLEMYGKDANGLLNYIKDSLETFIDFEKE